MSEALAHNVRTMRTWLAWTQEQLAAAAGVTVRTIQRVEAGEGVGSETLLALAGALDVSVPALKTAPPTEEDARKLAVEIGKYKVIPLVKLESASELRNVLGTDALCMDWAGDLTSEQQYAAAGLKDLLRDYGDIWTELSAKEQVDVLSTVQEAVERLFELELTVTFGTERVGLQSPTIPKPIPFETLHVVVAKASEPKLFVMVEKNRPLRFS